MKISNLFPALRSVLPVVYPYMQIHAGNPGTFVEQLYLPDHVLLSEPESEPISLASYGDHSGRMTLCFRPKTQVCVAALLMRGHLLGTREHVYELPELGDRANYRQVAALAQYRALRDSLKHGARPARTAGMPAWGVVTLVASAMLLTLVLITPTAAPKVMPAPATAKKAIEAPTLSSGDQLNAEEKSTLAQVVKDSGIELRSGSQPFVIFSDPNCPACKQLELQLEELNKHDSNLAPVVVPVSFKTGSKEAVEGVLCAKDVVAAWHAATSGGEAAPSCKKGQEQAQTNNAAFAALRFDRTPTIVTSSGKVAVGAKDFEGLVRWIKANSND